jgi:4-amino-4-deoxychorismate lyase
MKHLNRLEQVLARLEWDDAQIAEGLMCDQKGRIVEGVSTNLFLVSGGRLLTPVIDHCGVAGVMRGFILDVVAPELALNTEQVHCERALLGAAQEVFLCNAVIGVWPVRQLGAKRWPLGPVTRRVQAHVAQFLAS